MYSHGSGKADYRGLQTVRSSLNMVLLHNNSTRQLIRHYCTIHPLHNVKFRCDFTSTGALVLPCTLIAMILRVNPAAVEGGQQCASPITSTVSLTSESFHLLRPALRTVKSDQWLHHVRLSVCLSTKNNSYPNRRIFMKRFVKSVEKVQLYNCLDFLFLLSSYLSGKVYIFT
jgi:hypothetical protein